MALIQIRMEDVDGVEEIISEYICDEPDCPNPGVRVVGVVDDATFVICAEHARMLDEKSRAIIDGPDEELVEAQPPATSMTAHPWF